MNVRFTRVMACMSPYRAEVAKSAKKRQMNLSWVKLSCDRCGGERIAKRACPECGARPAPHETQPDLDRRKRILDELRAGRRPATPNAWPNDDAAATSAALKQVLEALGAVSNEGQDASQLLKAFAVIDQLAADTSILLLRPHLNMGRRKHQSILKAREGLEVLAESLGAPSLKEAQECAARGQGLIDQGEDELELTRHDVIGEQVDAGVPLLEALGSTHAEPTSLTTFTEVGQRLAHATGLPEGDIGLQVTIEGLDVAASSLDRERVLRLSSAAEKVLSGRPDVIDDSQLRSDLLAALMLVETRAVALTSAIEANEIDLTLVSRSLDLVTTVRERGLKVVVMPLLAAIGEGSLEDLRRKKTGAVLLHGERLIPELELSGLDRTLRDGGAHEDFRIDQDLIVLDRGNLSLTAEELADRVLAVTEYFTGILRGVLVTMASTNRTLPEPNQLPLRLQLEVIRYLLSVQGVTEPKLQYEGNRAILQGLGEVSSWTTLVAALDPLLPPSTTTLEATFRTNTGSTHHGRADLEAYRTFATRKPEEQPACCSNILACMPVFAATRFNGQNPFDDDSWLRAATHLVSEHKQDEPLLERLRRGRKARDFAALASAPTDPIDALLTRTRKVQGMSATTTLKGLRLAPLPNSTTPTKRE